MTIDEMHRVSVKAGQTVTHFLPHAGETTYLVLTTDQDIVMRIGGEFGAGPALVRAGGTITLDGVASDGTLTLQALGADAEVNISVSYDHEPSAVDRLADLARDG